MPGPGVKRIGDSVNRSPRSFAGGQVNMTSATVLVLSGGDADVDVYRSTVKGAGVNLDVELSVDLTTVMTAGWIFLVSDVLQNISDLFR